MTFFNLSIQVWVDASTKGDSKTNDFVIEEFLLFKTSVLSGTSLRDFTASSAFSTIKQCIKNQLNLQEEKLLFSIEHFEFFHFEHNKGQVYVLPCYKFTEEDNHTLFIKFTNNDAAIVKAVRQDQKEEEEQS